MNEYNIPITWQCYKSYKVKAKNLQEAIETALREFLAEPDENYLDDSFDIEEEMDYSEEYDKQKAINNIYKDNP